MKRRMRLLVALTAMSVGAATACNGPLRATEKPQDARPSAPSPHRNVLAVPVHDVVVRRHLVIGYSVQHHPIVAIEIGDADSPRRALIVGGIHGDEPAGIAIARALSTIPEPNELDLWIVPNLNPDGLAAHTRGDANGVDLNRNFPDNWRPLGSPRSLHYAGPTSLSEPESRAAAALLRRLHPTLGIWYHQALDLVDSSQGNPSLERRYAADTGMPLRPLTDYPGSATGYEDQLFGPSAFVVELPAGPLTAVQIRRHVRAVLDVANGSAPVRA